MATNDHHTAPRPTTVDDYLRDGCGRCSKGGTPDCKVVPWNELLVALRQQIADTGMDESIKWGAPCYTEADQNVGMLSALSDGVVFSFFRGNELQDPAGLLEAPGPNSRFARYLRYTTTEQLTTQRDALMDFVTQARELAQAGPRPKTAASELELPEELLNAFAEDPTFEQAFSSLTPGRQRGWVLYIGGAKQSKTRVSRIERCAPKVFAGKGWNER